MRARGFRGVVWFALEWRAGRSYVGGVNFFPRLIAALVLAGGALTGVRGEEMSGRFLVRSWQSEDGLPSNVVRSVTQATDGYLWVATAEGVVRFDGVRFTGFATERRIGSTGNVFATDTFEVASLASGMASTLAKDGR